MIFKLWSGSECLRCLNNAITGLILSRDVVQFLGRLHGAILYICITTVNSGNDDYML